MLKGLRERAPTLDPYTSRDTPGAARQPDTCVRERDQGAPSTCAPLHVVG
jgi:hypothetical protein